MFETTLGGLHDVLLDENRYQSTPRTARYYVGQPFETTLTGAETLSDSAQISSGVGAADIRVHRALTDNRRIEILTVLLAGSIFPLAVGLLLTAYWTEVSGLVFGGLALGAVFHWAVRQILHVRRVSRILDSLPVMVRVLPPEEVALAMMERLRPRGRTV